MGHRPAVIIGVGGTGQQVLTYVKADLKADNDGRMPDNIRLLCFDTMPEAVEAGGNQANQRTKEVFSYQNERLENLTEFFGLSGNGWRIGEEVIQGQLPHIGKREGTNPNYTWFDAPYYRQTIPQTLWDLDLGAARIRQFGRLALFMNVPLVRAQITDALTAVRNAIPHDQPRTKVEIMVVSSLAGGTGAGLFLDVALLACNIASTLNLRTLMRGFLVLPTAFTRTADENEESLDMRARSFAAWRELDRFMHIGANYGTHQIHYQGAGGQPLSVNTRPFDRCYLIDSRSNQNSLESLAPELGVMPTVAEFISLVLDQIAGVEFNNDDANRMMTGGFSPGYGAFRAFSLKVPIYYDIHGNALHFAKELLERWLIPIKDPETHLVKRIANNKNQEKSNQQGRDEVLTFLQAERHPVFRRPNRLPGQIDGQNDDGRQVIESSPIFSHIAKVNRLRNQPARLTQLQDEEARGGASFVAAEDMVGVGTYLGRLISFPTDANRTHIVVDGIEREARSAEVIVEANTHVWDEVPPSKDAFGVTGYGDGPMDALARFRDRETGIPHYERKHFGAGAGNVGRFGDMLAECSAWQIARFTEILRDWTAGTLNGRVLNVYQGLSGKLGYVLDFYAELEAELDFFLNTHLAEVLRRRNAENIIANAQEDIAYALGEMENWAHKKCFVFFVHPRAHQRQRDYLDAVDYYHSVRKDEMVFDTVREIAERMLAVVRSGHETIRQWANALVLSGTTAGLYSDINQDAEVVDGLLVAEKNQPRVKYITPEHEYRTDIHALDEALKGIQWDVSGKDARIGVACQIVAPTGQTDDDGTVLYHTIALQPGTTDIDRNHNRQVILSISRPPFERLRNRRTLINQVMQINNQDENFTEYKNLANYLVGRSDVLVQLNQTAGTEHHGRQVYLRSKDPNEAVIEDEQEGQRTAQVNYVNALEQSIRAITVGETYRNLGSSDQYKLTIAQYTVRIMNEDFSIWGDLKRAYLDQINKGNTRLHIFPAESNAVFYESQLNPVLNKPYRAFHPHIIMFLENLSKLKLYFECRAFGFITQSSEGDQFRSIKVEVPEMGDIPGQTVTLTKNAPDEPWPDMFEIIEKFIAGLDSVNHQRRIIWSSLRKSIRYRKQNWVDDELSAADAYQFQRTDPGGVIQILRAKARERRNAFIRRGETIEVGQENHGVRRDDGQEYEDLADLGEIFYHEFLEAETHQARY